LDIADAEAEWSDHERLRQTVGKLWKPYVPAEEVKNPQDSLIERTRADPGEHGRPGAITSQVYGAPVAEWHLQRSAGVWGSSTGQKSHTNTKFKSAIES
jgi:hypothetical protein